MSERGPAGRERVHDVGGVGIDEAASDWEGCTADELRRYWGLPNVHLFRVVGSTNDIARRLAAYGAPAGTLVLAEEQRSGRGRGGRTWASPPGVGLWASIVMRGLTPRDLGPLPLKVALAVASALDPWTAGSVRVKWPNDLLVDGRKLGGILCEAAWDGQTLDHVVAGVGLNFLQAAEDFPEEIRPTATSLRIARDGDLSRFELATAVLERLRVLIEASGGAESALANEFSARDALLGEDVEVREPDTRRLLVQGTARGIAPDGALLIEVGADLVPVRAGTVRIRRA